MTFRSCCSQARILQPEIDSFMSARGTDCTRILSDLDLVRQAGKRLEAYRGAPSTNGKKPDGTPCERDQGGRFEVAPEVKRAYPGGSAPIPSPSSSTPPLEPHPFTPNWGSDHRRHPRVLCFVAVELHVEDSTNSIGRNLSNTSAGRCLVEMSNPVKPGAKVDMGWWVPNGKIRVKGFALGAS